MEKLILEKKKEAFNNAIKAYLEFKKTLPLLLNNKINFEMLDEYQNDKYIELQDNIWECKWGYIDELNNQNIFNKQMIHKIIKQDEINDFDYNNKDLFVIHSNYEAYPYQRFTLVGVKEDKYVKLGLSICNIEDNFSRKLGRELAYKRAVNGHWSVPLKLSHPLEIRKHLQVLAISISENIEWYKKNCIL